MEAEGDAGNWPGPTAMKPDLSAILAALREGLAALYGPRLCRVVLFGSQARGEFTPHSDIDVLLVLMPPVDPFEEISRTSALRAELNLRYGILISCLFVSEHEYEQERSPLMLNVRREGGALTPEQKALPAERQTACAPQSCSFEKD
jgi:predicted nucleotidyltransferase